MLHKRPLLINTLDSLSYYVKILYAKQSAIFLIKFIIGETVDNSAFSLLQSIMAQCIIHIFEIYSSPLHMKDIYRTKGTPKRITLSLSMSMWW